LNFILDENVPRSIKRLLQEKGHNALILDDLNKRGISNGEVAQLSIKKKAIIITFDSDFLKLKKNIEAEIRAIYIDLHPRDPKIACNLLKTHLDSCLDLLKVPKIIILIKEGYFVKENV
jgi:predicted nuclease of predicted toxin-antitoxin system